jgi:hypothetical protein
MLLTFDNLNGSVFTDTVPTYSVETINSTSFYVIDNGSRSDNGANTSANTGTVIASGIGDIGLNAVRTFYLSNVKGSFNVSDDASGSVEKIISIDTGAEAKITSVIDGDLIDNSGQVIYIENMSPITRSNDQSEKVRIILEF